MSISSNINPFVNYPIFNPNEILGNNTSLTISEADARYLIKTGDTASGLISFNQGMSGLCLTANQSNITALGTLTSLRCSGFADILQLRVGTTNSDTGRMISCLDSSQSTGQYKYITLGKLNSAGDQAELSFLWNGTNDATNSFNVGFFGTSKLFTLQKQGRVGINNTSPTYALDVLGDIRATGNLYGNVVGSISTNSVDLLNNLICEGDSTFTGKVGTQIGYFTGSAIGYLNAYDNPNSLFKPLSINNDAIYITGQTGSHQIGINTFTTGYTLNIAGTLNASGSITGTLGTASQPNITSLGTLTGLSTSGSSSLSFNITDASTGSVSNNLSIDHTLSSGTSVNGIGSFIYFRFPTNTGVSVASAKISGVSTNVSNGSHAGKIVLSSVFNASLIDTATFSASGASTTALTMSGTSTITATSFTGTLTTASQPNITSLGTLTTLAVSGSITQLTDLNMTGLISCLNPTLTAGNINYISLGRDASNYNLTQLKYWYIGNNSTSNRLEIGFYGNNSVLVARADSRVGINNASPAYSLDVVGTCNVSGSLTGTLGTASQPNITSLGTLTTFTCSDIQFNTGIGAGSFNPAIQGLQMAGHSLGADIRGYLSASGGIGSINLNNGGFKITGQNCCMLSTLIIGTLTPTTHALELTTNDATKPGVGGLWTVSSDKRLKNNIEDANLNICYDNIKKINLKRFGWCDEYINHHNCHDKHVSGFIADEIEEIHPKSVKIHDKYGIDDCKTLNIENLLMDLFGCVKFIQNKLDKKTTEQQITLSSYVDLEDRIEDLIQDLNIEKKKFLDLKKENDALTKQDAVYLGNDGTFLPLRRVNQEKLDELGLKIPDILLNTNEKK